MAAAIQVQARLRGTPHCPSDRLTEAVQLVTQPHLFGNEPIYLGEIYVYSTTATGTINGQTAIPLLNTATRMS